MHAIGFYDATDLKGAKEDVKAAFKTIVDFSISSARDEMRIRLRHQIKEIESTS